MLLCIICYFICANPNQDHRWVIGALLWSPCVCPHTTCHGNWYWCTASEHRDPLSLQKGQRPHTLATYRRHGNTPWWGTWLKKKICYTCCQNHFVAFRMVGVHLTILITVAVGFMTASTVPQSTILETFLRDDYLKTLLGLTLHIF